MPDNARHHDAARVRERRDRALRQVAASRTLDDRCRRHQRIERYLPDLAEALGHWPEFRDAVVLELKVPAHPHRDQLLPDGATCVSCANYDKCTRLDLASSDQAHCDFLPSRYRERQPCQET